jgi:peptidoglycan/LPS O-acetylase OafA/YrhL
MSSSKTSYLYGLDGLRGIAVTAVLVFHANLLPGGYLGVDLFFVVSGFLITRLLLDEIERNGTIDLKRFWSRRMKRLYPAMLVTLVMTAEIVWLFGDNADRTQLKGDGLGALFYIANWKTILSGASYWDAFKAPAPLSHLWSLAIEEQFYVVWPLALMLVLRFVSGRRAAVTIGCVAVAGTAASWISMFVFADPAHIDRVYLGTDARMGSILLGASVAALLYLRPAIMERIGALPMNVISVVCLALLVPMYASVKYTEFWLYRGGLVGQAFLTTGLMLAAIQPRTFAYVVSNLKPLRWIGRQSYALYLVHMPIYWLYSTTTGQLKGFGLLLIGGGASLALAVGMSRAVENPLRFRTWTRREAQVGFAAALAFVSFAVVGPAAADNARQSVEVAGPQTLDALLNGPADPNAVGSTVGGAPNPAAGPTTSGAGPLPGVLVVGDSVSGNIAEALDAAAAGRYKTYDGHVDGCSIIAGDKFRNGDVVTTTAEACVQWPTRWAKAVEQLKPSVIIIHSRWDLFEQRVDGEFIQPCSPAFADKYAARYQQMWDAFKPAPSRTVIFVTPPLGTESGEQGKCLLTQMRALTQGVPNVVIADLQATLCAAGPCVSQIDGQDLYFDGTHFGGFGLKWVAGFLSPQFVPLLDAAAVTSDPGATNNADTSSASAADSEFATEVKSTPVTIPPPVDVLRAELLNGMKVALPSATCAEGTSAVVSPEHLLMVVNCTVDGVEIVIGRYDSDSYAHLAAVKYLGTNFSNGATDKQPEGELSRIQLNAAGVAFGTVRGPNRMIAIAPSGGDEATIRQLQQKLDTSLNPVAWAP